MVDVTPIDPLYIYCQYLELMSSCYNWIFLFFPHSPHLSSLSVPGLHENDATFIFSQRSLAVFPSASSVMKIQVTVISLPHREPICAAPPFSHSPHIIPPLPGVSCVSLVTFYIQLC